MFGGIGTPEILFVLVIVLLLFGPKNLPKLAKAMGSAIRDFKSGIKGVADDDEDESTESRPAQTSNAGQTQATVPPAPSGSGQADTTSGGEPKKD